MKKTWKIVLIVLGVLVVASLAVMPFFAGRMMRGVGLYGQRMPFNHMPFGGFGMMPHGGWMFGLAGVFGFLFKLGLIALLVWGAIVLFRRFSHVQAHATGQGVIPCPNCGRFVQAGWVACPYCAQNLAVPAAPVQPQPPVAEEPPAETQPPQPPAA